MTASYSKKQLEDHAALALEIECGSETQSARLRQIANRYGVRSGQ